MLLSNKKQKQNNKPTQKSWKDLENDKDQQKIYTENVNFVADLFSKHDCK